MYSNSQQACERGSTSLAMRENNQSHNEIPLRTHWASYNQTDIQQNKCWEGYGETGALTHCTHSGNVKWYSHSGKQFCSSSKTGTVSI